VPARLPLVGLKRKDNSRGRILSCRIDLIAIQYTSNEPFSEVHTIPLCFALLEHRRESGSKTRNIFFIVRILDDFVVSYETLDPIEPLFAFKYLSNKAPRLSNGVF
jgi:hypothetical protein